MFEAAGSIKTHICMYGKQVEKVHRLTGSICENESISNVELVNATSFRASEAIRLLCNKH